MTGRPRSTPRVVFICQYCGDSVEERETKYIKRKRFNCTASVCVSLAKKHVGDTNGMYGKTHTDDVKKAQAARGRLSRGLTYEERYGNERAAALKSQRSITFKKTWENPDRTLSFLGKKHSDHTKRQIGEASARKFTDDFSAKRKQQFQDLGYWIKDSDRNDYEIYHIESAWIRPMWDILTEEECRKKLLEHGVFNPRRRKYGVVRDHMISRRDGFDLKIFPEILRHPCNCQVLTVGENSSKRSKSSLTLYELFDRIEKYERDWVEQDLVLSLIQSYRAGNRWKRKEVV
jgi:hypothetical protein